MKSSRSALIIGSHSKFRDKFFWLIIESLGLLLTGVGCLSLLTGPLSSFHTSICLAFIFVGMFYFLSGLQIFYGSDFLWRAGLSLLYIFVGLGILFELFSVKILVGLLFLIEAFVSLYFSFSKNIQSGHAWFFFGGILSLLAGGLILWSNPLDVWKVIITFAGLNFIYAGLCLFFQAKDVHLDSSQGHHRSGRRLAT